MKEIHFWYKWKKYTFGRNKINTLGRNLFLWWVDLYPPGEPGAMLPDKIQFQCEFLLAKYVENGLEYFRMKRYYAITPLKTKIGYFSWMKMST